MRTSDLEMAHRGGDQITAADNAPVNQANPARRQIAPQQAREDYITTGQLIFRLAVIAFLLTILCVALYYLVKSAVKQVKKVNGR